MKSKNCNPTFKIRIKKNDEFRKIWLRQLSMSYKLQVNRLTEIFVIFAVKK